MKKIAVSNASRRSIVRADDVVLSNGQRDLDDGSKFAAMLI
jgi:hypothetical protein